MNSVSQLSLWDEPQETPERLSLDDFPITRDVPFRWADGDTSEEAAQRMLSHVKGQTRYLYGGEFINHRLVSYYAHVLECWIDNGVVWGRCLLWPEGSYVNELQAGRDANEEDEEDEEDDI